MNFKKHLPLFLIFSFVFHTTALNGQAVINYFYKVNRELGGAELKVKVDSLIAVCEKEGLYEVKEEIAFIYGDRSSYFGRFNRAIDYMKIAVEAGEQLDGKSSNHAFALYMTGRFLINNQQYSEAISYLERAIVINKNPFVTGESYAELGNCYRYMGDYFRSLDYFDKGFRVFNDHGEYKSFIVQSINLAWTYEEINTEESLSKRYNLLLQADSLLSKVEVETYNYNMLKNSIANQYTRDKYYDFNKSRDIYFDNLKRGRKNADTTTLSATYTNLAYLYNLEKRDSAKYWVDKGLELVKRADDRSRLHDNLSDFYLLRDRFKDALENIHKAMEISLESEIPIEQTPNELQLNNANAKAYIMYCLHQKSEILNKLYRETGNEQYLISLVDHVKAGDILSDMISGRSTSTDSKLIWRKEASSLYHIGTEAAKLLGDNTTAFYFIEKNKAILLAEEIAENTLSTSLPYHLAIRERNLKGQILTLEAANESSDGLFAAKKEYNQLKDSINLLYPEFVSQQTNIEIQNLKEAQHSLKRGQLMISYIWNRPDFSQEKIIGMAISKKDVSTFEIIADDEWHALIARFRNLVSKPLQTQEELTDFHKVSHQLYQSLLPEQYRNGEVSAKELLIVPDGALQNLPFEALITNAENPEYLVESVDLRYLYSYSFLKYNQQRVRKETEGKILAYAPIEFSEERLPALPYSGKEAQAVAMALDGEVRLNDQASKASFLNQSQDYKVLHLATHADAGEDHWIAFADDRLNLYELYTYENNADLVVLSGCNTLLGEIVRGEGVLSLARGFFYSGSQTVIASVWNTNDYAMSELMTNFYENLSDGKGKAEALNMAKRQYLANHKLSEASPYYWAAPLLIGDPNKVVEGTPKLLYWLLFVLAFIVALAMKRITRKKIA